MGASPVNTPSPFLGEKGLGVEGFTNETLRFAQGDEGGRAGRIHGSPYMQGEP